MVFGFFKKLIKYYVDKLIHWLRMKRLDLQLESEVKKYHQKLDKKVKKPKIVQSGKFGENGWSISIGNVDDKDTEN
jgi:hypothetical protein|tara:strand:- start:2114 stop:2341 length:228 start_codon:yes stop_codon:yes gene_type:complete